MLLFGNGKAGSYKLHSFLGILEKELSLLSYSSL